MIARLRLAVIAIVLLVLACGASADEPAFPPIGTAGKYLPGKFIWFDLVTNDLSAARQFYGAVFGWQFRTIGPAPASYTLIEDQGHSVGGMFMRAPPPGAKASARWLALISVSDPAQAARYVEQHGGKVIVPPASLPGRGTHALFRDPQGAVFGVLHSDSGDPPDTPVADDDFFWVDLLAPHPAQAAEFYRGLAGYEVNEREVGPGVKRAVLASGGYARAGIAPLPASVKQPGWLPYVLVNDVAATLAKVRAAGGRVLVEPRAELLDDNLAVIADPSGGVIGIVNWSPTNIAGPAQ
jgi:predicted enzyme related to lactoylglutathione lyase